MEKVVVELMVVAVNKQLINGSIRFLSVPSPVL
jgi:hypothetical protein